MGTTIKVVQRVAKVNKNGLAPVFIRITENRKSRLVSTGVSVPIQDWDTNNQCIRCKSEYIERQFTIDTIKTRLLKRVLTDPKAAEYKAPPERQTIEARFHREIGALMEMDKIGTATKYKGCLALLTKAGINKVRVDSLNREHLERFLKYLHSIGNRSNSIATKLSVLRAVYNKAKNDGIRMPDCNPFLQICVGKYWTATRKRALTKPEIMKVKGRWIPFDKNSYSLSFARDIFLFSYYEGGINFTDIAHLKASNVSGARLYYARRKTKKEMSFVLLDEARDIIDRYRQNGADDEQYLFPILDYRVHQSEQQAFNRIHKVLGEVNRNLRQLGEALNLSTELTTYVARHSFATILKRAGVSVEVISECLGHSDIKTTQIYLDSFGHEEKEKALKNLL